MQELILLSASLQQCYDAVTHKFFVHRDYIMSVKYENNFGKKGLETGK